MAEDRCFHNKGCVNANTLKKSPFLLKIIALAAAMVCGLSVCSIFLEQMQIPSKIHTKRVNLTEQSLRIVLNPVGFNSTEHIIPLATETTSDGPKLVQTQLRKADYRRKEEQLCVPVSLYVIVSMQRSGSKWFEAFLDSHDDIRSRGEIFSDVARRCNMTMIRKGLDKVFGRSKKNCFYAVGFKWMLNQGVLDNHEEIVGYLNRRGVSVIILFRRNHLRRLVSLKANNHDSIAKGVTGTHRAHAFSREEAEILGKYKPKLNIKGLIPTLEHMERLATDTLNNFGSTRHMVVYYEDLVQNQTDMLFVNPLRKSPLFLKMAALVACMVCSISFCSVFLNQMKTPEEIHMVRLNLTEQALAHVMRINLTEVNLSNTVRVNLTERTATFDVRANLSEITSLHELRPNFSEKALIPTRVNLTDKASQNPKVSQSEFLLPDYNKNKSFSSKEQSCMPVTLYAIVSVQRSGSKWFEALLNSHDNIRSHGEIFYNVQRKCNMTVIKAVLDRVYSLKWNVSTFRRKKKNCMAAVGFKWMLNQGILDNHEGIVDYLNHRGVSVILLFRRNHLRRLISHKANNYDGLSKELNGTHKAHAQSKNEADILASYRPKLNIRTLIPTLEHMESLVTNTMNYFKSTRHIVVYYEDLVQNQTQKMMEVLEFLKAPQKKLISGHVKIHTRPLAQLITNWNAVVKAIKHSKYRQFITDNDYEV